MNRWISSAVCIAASLGSLAAGAEWTAERVAVIEGFEAPECALVDPETGMVYVSNMVVDRSLEDPYWRDTRDGYISRLKPGGEVDVRRWRETTEKLPLSEPKGMCILGGRLYVADLTRIVYYDLKSEQIAGAIPIRGAERLNDMATDGQAVYVSDTGAGRIHRLLGRQRSEVKSPPAPNGITFFGGKMYGVSWTEHDVYRLDATGQSEPKPFGLAEHFQALDAVELLDDGTMIVSDFVGNKVSTIAPDGKTVRTLLEGTTPADLGLDRKRMLLYVPLLTADKVEVYRLREAGTRD